MIGRKTLQVVIEGQRVDENRAGNVGAIRQQALEVLRVQFLGQRRLLRRTGDIVQDCRNKCALLEAGRELPANHVRSEIDMVQVDRRRIGRPVRPDGRNGLGENTQHAAHALEATQRGRLSGQGIQSIRVKWIGLCKLRARRRPPGFFRQDIAMVCPQLAISADYLRCAGIIDRREQPPPDDLRSLIVSCRI